MHMLLTTDEMNRHLKGLLQAFKAAPSPESERALQETLNDFLYRAILERPTEANAVRVTAAPDLSRSEHGIPDRHTIFSGRYGLRRFLDETQPRGDEVVFVKHLPYTHSTTMLQCPGMDGHGACETVKFGSRTMRDDVRYLDVSLSNDWFNKERATFFLDEVKSVEFALVDNDAFTPLLDGCERRFTPASSDATHYLKFRAFHGYTGKDVHPSVQSLGDVWVPHWATELFTIERSDAVYLPKVVRGALHAVGYGGLFESTVNGYAACSPEHDPVLYEFRGAKVPQYVSEGFAGDVNAAAYLMQLNDAGTRIDITHRGRNIIRALSGKPVMR